ncbi:hypothetical protein H6A66_09660 [Bacteroides caecigallinarum]|uniref:DUF6965 family protein n=1 Tax=Bacteroides caecigallinarum TaxID=1411144 RepID=UPI00195DE426|nr:hypothetical protein [Bacteroides caecigallinarum]MBM6865431.1 hypothetical protein [Bacteroides caecigallinarum]
MAKIETKIYTREELAELEAWFKDIQLPESLQLDKATFIPDVRETLDRLVLQAEINCDNPKMQGPIYLLERLKAKLEETQK